ncbi:MAG: GNAT family N-acetyltransferase, partial [Neisseriaceae bacterium]|nr:GNAT family N-acetyltransferase [Neisseriaceae bacterium]
MPLIRPLRPQEAPPLALLQQANPSLVALEADLKAGVCHVLSHGAEPILGAAIMQQVALNTQEIMAIAICPSAQGQGLGKRLLAYLIDTAYAQGATTVFVGTANSSLNQLGFYQKAGFRLSHIVPNYFIDHYPDPI